MPQLVGSSCSQCHGRISNVQDGEFCTDCNQPVHHACRTASYEEHLCPICGVALSQRTDNLAEAVRRPSAGRGLLAHLFSPAGRSPRSVYILHSFLDAFVGLMLIAALGSLIQLVGPAAESFVAIGTLIVIGLMSWSEAAITVRRLHDMERPGSHFLLLLIPLYNIYLQLILVFLSGTIGENKYGPDPLDNSAEANLSGESLIEQGTRHEMNGDWDLAFDCYKQAAIGFTGQSEQVYAINCIKRLRDKMRLANPGSPSEPAAQQLG